MSFFSFVFLLPLSSFSLPFPSTQYTLIGLRRKIIKKKREYLGGLSVFEFECHNEIYEIILMFKIYYGIREGTW